MSGPEPGLTGQDHAGGGDEFHLPGPTIWPVVCGAGIALVAFGMLTSLAFSLLGLLLIVRSLGGWVDELRHE